MHDPRCVYHNVVIGMLTEKGLNNGQPGFWAYLLDRLDLAPGKRVLHLGCGAGYYSADPRRDRRDLGPA